MKKLVLSFCLIMSGCVSVNQTELGSHESDTLQCVDARENQMILNKGYRLVFFAKNFRSNVQVWLQPSTGKTMVLKSNMMSSKVCYVFSGLPASLYIPYDKSVEEATELIK